MIRLILFYALIQESDLPQRTSIGRIDVEVNVMYFRFAVHLTDKQPSNLDEN